MRRIRKRDIRKTRQATERQRDDALACSQIGEDLPRATARMPARQTLATTEDRGGRIGELLASAQMRSRVLELIELEIDQLQGAFGRDDQIELLRDLEAEVRSLPPAAALELGGLEDLVTEVAVSISYALEATEGLSVAHRIDELARAALFLPSSTRDGGN